MRAANLEALPHQKVAFVDAGKAIDALRPDGARDLRKAMNADRGLIEQAARGQTAGAIRAMVLESEIRIDTAQRADQFVAKWQAKARQLHALGHSGDHEAIDRTRSSMIDMAKALHRDPQLESLLRNRIKDLGISTSSGASLSHDLQHHPALWRGRGLGR